MAFSSKLASLFVEFTTKGADELKQQIGSIKSEMEKIPKTVAAPKVAAATQTAQAGAQAAKAGQGAVAALGEVGAAGALAGPIGAAAAMLVGLVKEGLQGTTIQERLNLQWQELTRQIADVFLPVIQRVSDIFGRLLTFTKPLFRALGDLVELLLRGLDPAIEALIRVLRPLADILTTNLGESTRSASLAAELFANSLLPATTALELLGKGLEWLANKIREWFGFSPRVNRPELARVPGGFEAVQESFRRVQQQAVRQEIGKPPVEQQQLEQLKQINQNTAGTTRKVGELKPAVV